MMLASAGQLRSLLQWSTVIVLYCTWWSTQGMRRPAVYGGESSPNPSKTVRPWVSLTPGPINTPMDQENMTSLAGQVATIFCVAKSPSVPPLPVRATSGSRLQPVLTAFCTRASERWRPKQADHEPRGECRRREEERRGEEKSGASSDTEAWALWRFPSPDSRRRRGSRCCSGRAEGREGKAKGTEKEQYRIEGTKGGLCFHVEFEDSISGTFLFGYHPMASFLRAGRHL